MQNVSNKAASLIGSEIIKLGAEINQKIKEGHQIYNLTIGDFNPEIFPIPDVLKQYIVDAYTANQTNYPAADGMPELKQAVLNFIFQKEQINYSNDEILIASGGRPVIYAAYQTIVDPTDKVIYPVPSWNNNHYCHLSDAQKIEIPTHAADGFMPTANELKPHMEEAALLALWASGMSNSHPPPQIVPKLSSLALLWQTGFAIWFASCKMTYNGKNSRR